MRRPRLRHHGAHPARPENGSAPMPQAAANFLRSALTDQAPRHRRAAPSRTRSGGHQDETHSEPWHVPGPQSHLIPSPRQAARRSPPASRRAYRARSPRTIRGPIPSTRSTGAQMAGWLRPAKAWDARPHGQWARDESGQDASGPIPPTRSKRRSRRQRPGRSPAIRRFPP